MARPIYLKFKATNLKIGVPKKVRVLGTIRYTSTCRYSDPKIEIGMLLDQQPNRLLISGSKAWVIGSFSKEDSEIIENANAGEHIVLSCAGCEGIRLSLKDVRELVKTEYEYQTYLRLSWYSFNHAVRDEDDEDEDEEYLDELDEIDVVENTLNFLEEVDNA